MRRLLEFGVVAIALFAMGCGASRQSGICGDTNPAPTATGDVAALEAEADAAWAQRDQLAQAEQAVELWGQITAIDPSRADIRVKLAQAHYFIADAHLFFDKEVDGDPAAADKMLEHYQEGQFQAEFALGQSYPRYRTKFCARQPFESALQEVDRGAVPAMYWYATNLGRYALQKSLVEVLNHKDRIKAMMEAVKRLDPSYWYHAGDRYFGAYYTRIPFPSGDLPLSRKHFEASISGSPQYLATKVLFAQMNLGKAGNCDLFRQVLEEVIAFDASTTPEIAPENAAEQRKAQFYLDQIDFLCEAE